MVLRECGAEPALPQDAAGAGAGGRAAASGSGWSRRGVLGFAVAFSFFRHPGLGSHQSTTLMGFPDPGSTFFLAFRRTLRSVAGRKADCGSSPQ